MKKIIVGLLVGVVLIGAGCGVANKNSQPNQETIKIGVIAPLSGEMANWGDSIKGATEIALAEKQANGSLGDKKVQFIFEDNKSCDGAVALTAFNKLVNVDGVKETLINCSGATLAVAPVAEQSQTILLAGVATAGKISQAGDYVFRTDISDNKQGEALMKFLTGKLKAQKIAVIYSNNDYGQGLVDTMKAELAKVSQSLVASEAYEVAAADFRTNLIKIKSASPDALVIICYGKEGGIIAKQARELGLSQQIIGTDNFGAKEVLSAGGAAVEGAIFTSPALDETNPIIIGLKEKYRAKYGTDISVLAAAVAAYDAANIMMDAVVKAGTDPEAVKNYLYHVANYPGASGVITIDANGDADKPIGLQQVKNGKFVPYQF